MTCRITLLAMLLALLLTPRIHGEFSQRDPRNIRTGHAIPDEGYCDQPYVVVLPDGVWLCVLTTGKGNEGDRGQHVVSTRSENRGKTWSPLVDIEPASGPEASWVVPLLTPSGRVYAFYDYNGDGVERLGKRPIRADMLGWYAFRYSDDGGKTWSKDRTRIPIRVTACDRTNDWQGKVQIFWGIAKPQIFHKTVFLPFTKLGKYMLDQGEGWILASENLLDAREPRDITWKLLPEGEHGIRNPDFGSVQEEHNLVALSDGSLYCVYRTTTGRIAYSISRDRGKTWPLPRQLAFEPEGRLIEHPRACPKIWKTKEGNYLLWIHNHNGTTFRDRNPAWIVGGVEKGSDIHWSQPEILLYDPDPNVRISYPDLIEQEGRFWVTETQKTVARVHEIPRSLLEGTWASFERKTPIQGATLDVEGSRIPADAPTTLPLDSSGGFTIDLWTGKLPDQSFVLLATQATPTGDGIRMARRRDGAIQFELRSKTERIAWESQPGLLTAGQEHHIVLTLDAGPRIVMGVVDGSMVDGGESRVFGWTRWKGQIDEVRGTIPWKGSEHLRRVRVYPRALKTYESIANFRAGPEAR